MCRWSLPNARIMTCPPRMNRTFGNTSDIMIKANELERNTQTYVDFMSKFTGERGPACGCRQPRTALYCTAVLVVEAGIIHSISRACSMLT